MRANLHPLSQSQHEPRGRSLDHANTRSGTRKRQRSLSVPPATSISMRATPLHLQSSDGRGPHSQQIQNRPVGSSVRLTDDQVKANEELGEVAFGAAMGMTPNLARIWGLLDRGAEPARRLFRQPDGTTSVHHFAASGRVDIMQLMKAAYRLPVSSLIMGATTGWTPLHFAAEMGHTEMCAWLMAEGEISEPWAVKDAAGNSPSEIALLSGYLDLALMLSNLDKTCDPKNWQKPSRLPALFDYFWSQRNLVFARYLVRRFPAVQAYAQERLVAYAKNQTSRSPAAIRALASCGVDLSFVTTDRDCGQPNTTTPLAAAVFHMNRNNAEALLSCGADPDSLGYGNTSLYWATTFHLTGTDLSLLARGADPNLVVRSDDWSRLHSAIARRDFALADALLRHGAARTSTCPQTGRSPLAEAIRTENPEWVRLLITHGARPVDADIGFFIDTIFNVLASGRTIENMPTMCSILRAGPSAQAGIIDRVYCRLIALMSLLLCNSWWNLYIPTRDS